MVHFPKIINPTYSGHLGNFQAISQEFYKASQYFCVIFHRNHHQQDNAPSHVSNEAMQWINRNIGTIASGRRIRFPPNSPDLSPLDFSVWKRIQDSVHEDKCKTLMDLRVSLKKHCDILMSDYDYLEKIHNHWVKRVEKCIEQQGGHFEHMLD